MNGRVVEVPVVYLDIDGVLNGHAHCHGLRVPRICPEPVAVLNRVIESMQIDWVIISTWGSHIKRGFWTLEGFARMLRTHGVRPMRIVDYLEPGFSSEDHRERVKERTNRVLEHQLRAPNRPWLVLDDLPLGVPKAHLVRPNPATGLSPYQGTEILDKIRAQFKFST